MVHIAAFALQQCVDQPIYCLFHVLSSPSRALITK